ncbi:MAG: response regulator, partial [Ruminococcus sp.]|nr:response regulator [Ruminococcus sp.]MDD6446971.1 response regulator [Ruminococcus sp.]
MEKTKVMIVDDSRVARELFEMYIKSSDNCSLVRVEESAMFADTFLKSNTAIDLIIMDILMNDGSNGLDAAARIKKIRPDIKIVAVTSMAESSWVK